VALIEDNYFSRFAAAVPRDQMETLRDVLTPELDGPEISPETKESAEKHAGAFGLTDDADLRRRLDHLLREADRYAGPIEPGEEQPAGLLGLSPTGLVKWLSMLVQHESRFAEVFPTVWKPQPEFAAQVHLMMDMEHHYQGRKPEYDFATEQHRRMREATQYSTTKLIGFTAFDPFREDSLDIVKTAINNGFTGVKFYPPNGYRPIDNTQDDIGDQPPAAQVNERNLEFFHWCVEKDVPVFAHCTPSGMESRKGAGELSNPAKWRTVLEIDGLAKLRLCLGHAGGQDGWMAGFDAEGEEAWKKSFASEALKLSDKYPNVYLDFGYFDGILEDGGPAFTARLEWALAEYPDTFAAKCCYGTDWHLMVIKSHAPEYASRFLDCLENGKTLSPHIDAICFENAARFLKL
jgi:predicted TIM-barrel fold metal-dependent hydrolase